MPDIYTSKKKKRTHTSKKVSSDTIQKVATNPKEMKKELSFLEKEIMSDKNLHKMKGHSHNPFSSYSLRPDRVKIDVADSEEKIILLLRKHPITNFPWILGSIIAVVIPAFFPLMGFYDILPLGYKFVIQTVWYLLTFAFVLEKFLQWFFNVNIVTDERIIDVNFRNLIFREISDANIDQIQDVTVRVGGGIRTIVGYGDVVIQTAAEILNIEFEDVPTPDIVAKILRALRVEEEIEKMEGRVR